MNRALLIALALIPAACAGPRVETAALAPVTVPQAWQSAGPVEPVDPQWWRAFGDPVLDRLVETALADNSDIAIAAARVRAARAATLSAHAAQLPTLGVGAEGERARVVDPFEQPVVLSYGEPAVEFAYEADVFGALADRSRAARADLAASRASRDSVRLMVAATAVRGYVGLRALDARLDVAQATLALRTTSARLARERADKGYSPELEARQAEAEREATARLVPQLELAIARQEHALCALIGSAPAPIARGRTLDQLALPAIPAGASSRLLEQRSDVFAAGEALAATDARLAAARKEFLPQFRFSAMFGGSFATIQSNPFAIWSLGGSVLAPLFEGGRLKAGAEAAAAGRDAAAQTWRKVALNALRETADSLVAVDRIDAEEQHLVAQRSALAQTLRLATNRYRAGYTPHLDQIDAQRNLLAVDLALIESRADALNARVALFQAIGGGWQQSGR